MSLNLLAILMFLNVPLLGELELIAQRERRTPRLRELVRLANVRRQRWFVLYLILLALLAALIISAKTYPAGASAVFLVVLANVAVWFLAYRKVRNLTKGEE
jgi:Flp pilus assembly protein TadB